MKKKNTQYTLKIFGDVQRTTRVVFLYRPTLNEAICIEGPLPLTLKQKEEVHALVHFSGPYKPVGQGWKRLPADR